MSNRRRRKAQTSVARYQQASVSVMSSGLRGEKFPEFRQDIAVERFRGWCFAAARINATSAASVPLRLYARDGSLTHQAFNGKRVRRVTREYLGGWQAQQPGRYALHKAADFRDDFVEVETEHPVLDLLGRVSDQANGYDFAYLRHIYLQLTGNAYVHPVLSEQTGWPTALYLMPSQWVTIIPGRAPGDPFVLGYVYGASWSMGRLDFAPDEVRHFRYPNPRDLYYGLGMVEAGWESIRQDALTHRMDSSFLENYSRPDYAVIVKAGSGEKALDRFEQKVAEKLRGVRHSGEFLSITGDVQIVPLQFPPKDLAGRDDIVKEIAAVFGVPEPLLKGGDAILSNYETGQKSWKENTILPMLRQDEDVLNEWLIPAFELEGEAFLAYDNPVPDDRVFDRDTRVAYVVNRVMTPNEARAEIGLDDIDGGDELLVPTGLVPLDAAGKPQFGFGIPLSGPRPVPAESLPPARPALLGPKSEESPEPLSPQHLTAITTLIAQVRAGDIPRDSAVGILTVAMGFSDEQAQSVLGSAGTEAPIEPNPSGEPEQPASPAPVAPKSYSHKALSQGIALLECEHKAIEADGPLPIEEALYEKVREAFASVLTDQDKIVSDWVKQHFQKAAASDLDAMLSELRAFDEQLAKLAEDSLRDLLEYGGRLALANLPGELVFDVNPGIDKWLKNYTFELARITNSETINYVQQTVQDGIESGASAKEIGKHIQGGGIFGGARSEMIARTETANVAVQGHLEAWEQSGIVVGKKWLLAPDACEFCEAIATEFNQKVLGLRDHFYDKGATLAGAAGGTMSLDYKPIDGPTLHPHCRCSLEPVLEGEA